MTERGVRRIDSVAEFLAIDHPVLRYDIGGGFAAPAYAWGDLTDGGALFFQRHSDRGSAGGAAVGRADAIRSLVAHPQVREVVADQRLSHLSVPRESFQAVEDLYAWGGGGEWDWMWSTTVPPLFPREDEVRSVGPDAGPELTEFLQTASPRTHGQPFARPDQLWVVIRDHGVLVACGSWEPAASGLPNLAGIAVHPPRRGEGYGAAITAYLTRAAIGRFGACTLGMFADNVTARRLYHGLGYRTGAEWKTRWIAGE